MVDINSNDYPLLDGRYALVKTVGSGATCKVKLAKDLQTGKTVAVKILKSENSNEKAFKAEIETLKKSWISKYNQYSWWKKWNYQKTNKK